MTRSGDEMIFELSSLLKTAAKKEEKYNFEKHDDKEKKECEDCEEENKKKSKKDKKKEKKSKKASKLMGVVNSLVRLASDLDNSGDIEASSLVDDALQVILKNIKKDASFMDEDDFEEDETLGVDMEIRNETIPSMRNNDEDSIKQLMETIRGMSPEEKDALKQLLS